MSARSSLFPSTALVTGGASGIGKALVDRLRAGGADVQVLDLADGFDVADPRAWEAVGPVELACLNAGVLTGTGDVTALTDEQYRRARPKRLRFAIFTQFGRVVRHARSHLLRLTTRALDALLRPGLRRVRVAAWAGP